MTRLSPSAVTSSAAFLPLLLLVCSSHAAPRPRPAAQADPVQEGITLYQQARYADAERVLQGASGTQASAYRGASLAKLKRYADAEGPAAAALAAEATHPVAAAGLGESLVGQRKYDAAIARMGGVIAAYATRDDRQGAAYPFYWRGQAYYAKKETARAIEDFQVFLQLAPNAPEAQTVRQLLGGLK